MSTPVRRRELLAGFGAGLCAGCLSTGTETGPPAAPGTSDEPGDGAVTLDATVVDSFTATHPGRLRLTLENRTGGLQLSLGVRRGIGGPFSVIRGRRQDDGRELVLFYRGRDLDSYVLCETSSETPIPEARVDGCWQPRCATGLEVISTHGSIGLGPGETLRGEYTVLDGFDDGCLPPPLNLRVQRRRRPTRVGRANRPRRRVRDRADAGRPTPRYHARRGRGGRRGSESRRGN